MAAATQSSAAPMSVAVESRSNLLQHRHVFGFKQEVRRNLHSVEGDQVIYPAGHCTVMYNIEKRQQTFFQGNEGTDTISVLALSPNQRYLAVAEKAVQDHGCVSIYDVLTTRKMTTCTFPDCDIKEYVSLAFSSENQCLLTQGGQSGNGKDDWTLVYWAWDKGRPMAAAKITKTGIISKAPDQERIGEDPSDSEWDGGDSAVIVHECSFNPADSSTCLVIGDAILKFLKYQDGVFKEMPTRIHKIRKAQNYITHCWLADERLVIGCENGELLLLDNSGELLSAMGSRSDPYTVLCLCSFSKGFVSGGNNATINFWFPDDDSGFTKKQEVKLDTNSQQGPLQTTAVVVRAVTMSSNEETLCFSTSNSQIYKIGLGNAELNSDTPAALTPEPLLTPFHVGPINGMDICQRKPLIATVGADKTVRLWNYEEKSCEMCKVFNEEAHSVAMHPSGFHVIIGFSDKLRAMNLLMEDLRPFKDIPIKGCKECKYSHGGHYFAATNSNTIQVYKTYTCELMLNLRGHNNKVRSIAWTSDDAALVTAGLDGGVYEYSILQEGHRASDWVHKGTQFTCVTVNTDKNTAANTMYVCGTDKMLKEVYNSSLQNSFECGLAIGQLLLGTSQRALFAGISEVDYVGPVRCYRFPLEEQDYTDYAAHCAPVTRLRVCYDDSFLFSCGEDGCLFVFDIRKKDMTTLPMAGSLAAKEAMKKRDASLLTKEPQATALLPFADEILVTRTFLDEKQAQLVELERQVDELSNQIEFQLRHRDLYHKEKIAEFEDKYGQQIEQERAKYELLREEKNDMEMECEENIRGIEERHAKQIQDLEASFQHKMMGEVGRYQKLSSTRDREHQEWEKEYKTILSKHSKELEENQKRFNEQKLEDGQQRQRILAEKELSQRVHRETLHQLEQDADREIEELKEQYEERLASERDDKVRLRGQAGIHRKHHEDLKRQMQKKEEEFKFFLEEARKKQEKIDHMIYERELNMKEIKDRDKTIGDKETKIYELKKQNAELEKFKFVLDYKIKELKAQIDPKNDDIAAMKRIIQGMDSDLEDYHRKNKLLQQDIANLQSKQSSLQDEILLQRKRFADSTSTCRRVKHDLHTVMETLQNPRDFKKAFIDLYGKHCVKSQSKDRKNVTDASKSTAMKSQTDAAQEAEETEIQEEYARQKEYLHKSVSALKTKLNKDSAIHRQDNMRAMQENMALIRNINELRKEIQLLKHEQQQSRLT